MTTTLNGQNQALGSIKCYVDGAIFSSSSHYIIGMCLRDEIGDFIKAKTIKFYGIPSVAEVEAIDLLETIKWCQSLNYAHVYFETDCKVIVDVLSGGSFPTLRSDRY